MTLDELKILFEKNNDEFGKFKNIINPRCNRADLCAFIMLNDLFPNQGLLNGRTPIAAKNIISSAKQDYFYLSINCINFVNRISETGNLFKAEDFIIDLIRCGVMFDRDRECLWMFT